MLETLSPQQLRSSERTLSVGTWAITAGAVLYSVLTVTPLVKRVSPPGWEWTSPILPLVVDAAVVIVVRLDAVLARLGGDGGPWPTVLRWMTGLMTLLLNIGDSALKGDLVGVAVHSVAPLLLIVTAEAGRSYRQAIALALERIERSRAAAQTAKEREHEEREQRQRAEREQEREADAREAQAAREHAEKMERLRADREAADRREEREHTARMQREQWEREEQLRQQEHGRAERERREREQRAKAARAAREQHRPAAVNATDGAMNGREQRTVNTAATAEGKLPEDDARAFIHDHVNGGKSVRQLADATGWSVGWVNARLQEAREATTAVDTDADSSAHADSQPDSEALAS